MIFSQKGNATFVALGITSVLLVSAAGAGAIISSTLQESPKVVNSSKALFAAEGAVESALYDSSETGLGYTLKHETAPTKGDPGYIEMTGVNKTKAQWETKSMIEEERDRTGENILDEAKRTVYLPPRRAETETTSMDDEVKKEFLKENWQRVKFEKKYGFNLYANTTKKHIKALSDSTVTSGECAGGTCEDTKSIFSKGSTEEKLQNMFMDIFIPNVVDVAGAVNNGETNGTLTNDALQAYNKEIAAINANIESLQITLNTTFDTYISDFQEKFGDNIDTSDFESIRSDINGYISNLKSAIPEFDSSSTIDDVTHAISTFNTNKENTLGNIERYDIFGKLNAMEKKLKTEVEIKKDDKGIHYDNVYPVSIETKNCSSASLEGDGLIRKYTVTNDSSEIIMTVSVLIINVNNNFYKYEEDGTCSIGGGVYVIKATINKPITEIEKKFSEISYYNPVNTSTPIPTDSEKEVFSNNVKESARALINAIYTKFETAANTLKNSEQNTSENTSLSDSIPNTPLFTWGIQAQAENFEINGKTVKYVNINSINDCRKNPGKRGVPCYSDFSNPSSANILINTLKNGTTKIVQKKMDNGIWLRIYNPQGLINANTNEGATRSFQKSILQYINRQPGDLMDNTDDTNILNFSTVKLLKPVLSFRMGKPQKWKIDEYTNKKRKHAFIRLGFEYATNTINSNLLQNFPVPDDVVRIKATGEANGYSQNIEVNVQPQEVAPMFDYAVFQQ